MSGNASKLFSNSLHEVLPSSPFTDGDTEAQNDSDQTARKRANPGGVGLCSRSVAPVGPA